MTIAERDYLMILALIDGLHAGRYQADTISGETTVAAQLRSMVETLLDRAELKRQVA